MEEFLGMDKDKIEMANEMREQALADEEEDELLRREQAIADGRTDDRGNITDAPPNRPPLAAKEKE